MKTITEFRSEYPQYDALSDEKLTKALHSKHYSQVDFDEFSSGFLGRKESKGGMAKAFGAGVDKVQELGYRAVKGFTDVGNEGDGLIEKDGPLAKFAQKGIDTNIEEQKAYVPTVSTYKDALDSPSNAFSYAGELIAGSVPYMAAAMTGVGAAGMAGGLSQEAYEAQPEDEKSALRAVTSGVGQMALERLGIKGSLGQIGKDVMKDGVMDTAKRYNKGEFAEVMKSPQGALEFSKRIVKGSLWEGTTEAGQEALAQWGAGKDVAEISGLDEAFVGGFVVGGVIRTSSEGAQRVMQWQQKSAPVVKNGIEELVKQGVTQEEAIEQVRKQSIESAMKQGLSEAEAVASAARTLKTEYGIEHELFTPIANDVASRRAAMNERLNQQRIDGGIGVLQQNLSGDRAPTADELVQQQMQANAPEFFDQLDQVDQQNTSTVNKVTETEKDLPLPENTSVSEKDLQTDAVEAPQKVKFNGLSIVEAPVNELSLSSDVPQFKAGSNDKGVVEPLGGKFDRTGVAPIQVWVRSNGDKEVVSGRHRLDLAARSGESTIPAQYHYEDSGFNKTQAASLDAILNVREGQGKVKDYVEFIKQSELSEKEADANGILARATGKRAYAIANLGSDSLITAHRNDGITDEGAVRIAKAAPNNETLQAVGIKAINDGKSIAVAENLVKAVKSMTNEQQQTSGDLFGFDDSAMIEAEELAKKASAKQSEIQRTLSAVQGAAKRPELAAKEGVNVKDPKAVNQRIAQLKEEKRAWDNWHTNPELVAQLTGPKKVEPIPDVTEDITPDNQDSLFGEPEPIAEKTPETTASQEAVLAPEAKTIDQAAHEAATSPKNDLPEPTVAQAEANNYKLGRIEHSGMKIGIENPEGSYRKGIDSDGKAWSNKINHHYGDLTGSRGADGDALDVFIKPGTADGEKVFVVDQVNPSDGKFDEHKVMMGFDSKEEAEAAYRSNYTKDWQGLGNITEASQDNFKSWLKDSDTTKPFAEKAEVIAPVSSLYADGMERVTHTVRKSGKELTGVVDNNLTRDEAKAIDPSTFRKGKDGWFIRENRIEEYNQSNEEYNQSNEAIVKPEAVKDDTAVKPVSTKTTAEESANKKPKKNFSWDAVELSKNYTAKELDDWITELTKDPDNKNNGGGIELYDKKTMKKIDKLGWAVTYLIQQKREGSDTSIVADEVAMQTPVPPKENNLLPGVEKAPKPKIEKIDDFGETLHGANKHNYTYNQQLSEDIDVAAVPLSKSFPQPDYEKLATEDADPRALAFIAQLRGEIKTKPRQKNKVGRWSEQVETARKYANKLLEMGKDGPEALIESLKKEGGSRGGYLKHLPLLLDIANDIPAKNIKALGNFKLEHSFYNMYRNEKNVHKWVVTNTEAKGGFGGMGNMTHFDTSEEAVAHIRSQVTDEVIANGKKLAKFDVWTERGKPGVVFVGKKLASRKYVELKQFSNAKEAREYINSNNEALVAALKEKKKIKAHRRPDNNPRIGADHRKDLPKLRSVVQGMMERADIDAKLVSDALIAHSRRPKSSSKFNVPRESVLSSFSSSNMNTKLNKSFSYMTTVNRKVLGNLNNTPALSIHNFSQIDIPSKRLMMSAMLGVGHDLKVRRDVIKLVPIDMVNDLSIKQFTPEGLLSDESMLSRALAIDADMSVGGIDNSVMLFIANIASSAAKLPSADDSSRVSLKDDLAVRAGEFDGISSELLGHTDVTPEDFTDAFSFRGTQFGNYVSNERRQQDLNYAYDGLMDLASILELPSKALSLNGDLGLAFGARGKGGSGAAAHYEPNTVVINLTKKMGSGSLAHEWWHALDNYFSKMDGTKLGAITKDFITEGGRKSGVNKDGKFQRAKPEDFGVREEVFNAFQSLTKAINSETKLAERSAELDKLRTKDYWGTVIEMTARSFERYVIDKLASQGFESDYLANIIPESSVEASKEISDYPYPLAAEMDVVNKAYDAIFDILETKETDKGTALFSRATLNDEIATDSNSVTVSELETNKVIEQVVSIDGSLLGKDHFVVVSTFDKLPKAIKDAAKDQDAENGIGGVYYQGKTYLVRDKLANAKEVEETIFHETYGHYGLRKLFGKELPQALNRLLQGIGGMPGLTKIAKKHGIDLTAYKEGLAQSSLTNAQAQTILMDELLAHLAQENRPSIKRLVKEVIGAIRQGLKRMGYKRLKGITDSELFYILKQARAAAHQADGNTNSDILFSRVSDAISAVTPKKQSDTLIANEDEGRVNKKIRQFQDKFKPLKTVQEIISKTKKIAHDANAYIAEELFHGKVEEDLRKMERDYVQPLVDSLVKNKINMAELDLYVIAKHAKERNLDISNKNDAFDGSNGSGMTNDEAQIILDKAVFEEKRIGLEDAANKIYAMTEAKRKLLSESGLLSDSELASWDSKFKFYVPLKGFANDEVDSNNQPIPRIGKGFAIQGRESMRALGRRTMAASPATQVIQDLTESVIRHRKNEVGNAFLKLVKSNPDADYWQVFTDEDPDTDRRFDKASDKVIEAKIPMAMASDKYFTTKVNGETQYIKIKDDRLMMAMKNLGVDKVGSVVQVLGKINRYLSTINTSFNPEFMISNMARDVQTAVFNVLAEQDLPQGKIKGKNIATAMVKDWVHARKGIALSLANKEVARDSDGKPKGKAAEYQELFDQFREDGAKTGYFDMKDMDQQVNDINTMLEMAKNTNKGKAIRFAKKVGDLVENVNQSVENAVRLSAYKQALDAFGDVNDKANRQKAASLAKNLTVNFNRKGEVGTTMNALYMFANASVQGSAQFLRSMQGYRDTDGKYKFTGAQKTAAIFATGAFALAAVNRAFSDDDDDEISFWDKIPSHIKERNIVIMKSVFGFGEPGDYISIPLPYGYNVFSVFGTAAEAAIYGNKTAAQSAGSVVGAVIGSFSPIGSQDSDNVFKGLAKTLAPTIMQPIVQLGVNENFYGGSIYQENFQFGTQKPDSAMSKRNTADGYKALSSWLNEATGGSYYRSGLVDISPEVFKYFVDFGTGAAGTFAVRTGTAVSKVAKGESFDDREVPFYRKVSGQTNDNWADQDRFYDRGNTIKQTLDEYKSLRGSDRINFRQENQGKLSMANRVKVTEKQLIALRKRYKAIESSSSYAAAEKTKMLDMNKVQQDKLVDKFNLKYNELNK